MGVFKEKHKKRAIEATAVSDSPKKRQKRSKIEDAPKPAAAVSNPEEVDFPRGGGTSFTAAEYKAIRSEAIEEIKDEEIFKGTSSTSKTNKRKRTKESDHLAKQPSQNSQEKKNLVRVEHLNYKRISVGMKIFCQIVEVQPYSLIVSLPDQLLGHVPITNISKQYSDALESLTADDQEFDEDSDKASPPELNELFYRGQFLRAVVTDVRPQIVTEGRISTHMKDNVEKASRRVELSLRPDLVNSGLSKLDLSKGMTLSAAIQSIEDHGYVLDIGVPDVSGFLRREGDKRQPIGGLLNVAIESLSEERRTCLIADDAKEVTSAFVNEIASATSVIPGLLLQGIVTSTSSAGLVMQVLGSFEGTVTLGHVANNKTPSDYKLGQRLKARVLYNVSGSSPPVFALTLKEHIRELLPPANANSSVAAQDRFPVGTTLSTVKVKRVEPERGLIVEVEPGLEGFIHISNISDEHVPSLSAKSGIWRIGTVHASRVIGFYSLDKMLQLSMKPSVLSQAFLRVNDVTVGDVVKGTVKKLTDSALFVSINGSVDGVIWPSHYADIILKHPQKRFKPGASIKCRVLAVDSERKRIELTAKKTLVESDLPILTDIESLETGTISHGTVWRILEKSLIIEFYNHIRAIVPAREASDTPTSSLAESFSIGKPVRVCLLSIDREAARLVASLRLAVEDTISNIRNVQVGQSVAGTVAEIHDENAILTLYPEKARAVISMRNIANSRQVALDELKRSIKVGERIDDLVVVSRNLDKGLLVVASQPSAKASKGKPPQLNLDSLAIGSRVEGRVFKHIRQNALIKFSGRTTGLLHLADISDNFENAVLPEVGENVKTHVLSIDRERKRLILSTRESRLMPDASKLSIDQELGEVEDLRLEESRRGFVKSVTDHGIFVSLGRNVDARVQIKELYDDYVKDWKRGFKENQVVKGRITQIDTGKKQVEMSLRRKHSAGREELTYDDLLSGQVIEGTVKKVEEYGVFVTINESRLSGLCHKSEISDNDSADVEMALRNFQVGDKVKAIVLSVDKEKRRISLGLKPSYFSDADLSGSDDVENVADLSNAAAIAVAESDSHSEEDADMDDDSAKDSDEDGLLDVDNSSFQAERPSLLLESQKPSITPKLSLNGFHWEKEDVSENGNELSTSDESDEELEPRARKKKRRQIEHDLTADMQTRMPESVADFERHLLASPNSSYLWLQYMSFQIQLAEIDKARDIGKRALVAINIREEQEKLNVWIGLLNVENTYGTQESLDAVFKDAVRHNDSKTIHLRMADIYEQSEKFDKAEEQYSRTCKKFGFSSKAWTLFGEFYLRHGKVEEARKLLPRSLQSLEKRKHLKTIAKFAQLEYKSGEAERGKIIFEGIVDSHKKRWDLWSIYIDMEASQKDIASVRNLFGRVLLHKMTSHKAKSFFKKWLELERRIGDEEGQQLVKEKALEWAQKSASGS